MKKTGTYFLLFCLALYFFKCNSIRQYTAKKTPHTASAANDRLDLNTKAYHVNDSLTEIFFEVKNDNLIYKRTDTSSAFYAEIKVSYSLCTSEDCKRSIDTSSFYLLDGEASEQVPIKSLVHRFKVHARFGNNYYLKMEVYDLNRLTLTNKMLTINKSDRLNEQNFFIESGGAPVYQQHFINHQHLSISSANNAVSKLQVYCYFKEKRAASPPFSNKANEKMPQADSSFELSAINGRFFLTAPEKGFYFIKADLNSDIGFCLYTFDVAFPAISSSNDMINACRYVMYKEEFDSCLNAPDKKQAIDKFWLNIGGSHERAREILKKYYARVKEANNLYSSYMEGWKTDRGMISIIFGEPTNVYKSVKDEIWVYGIETNPATLRFIFKKRQSPFSDNDFVLERSDFYKDAYYQAVDYWRQGIVYNERAADR